ncbi:hypothetical protein [Mucilaginibacter sp. OK098]|uniref:hypothetical protein n=1 Tax=Mucilaginibacter sp. OK098 TaxID=1855297 RepID=UPI00091E098F|nr:hypothetical protein [Mucilaginibacter sp. OK098]SHM14423.1 hypothetical protein SAMN05216524_101958 [Mucilaginibacter sp. OK098]
MRLKINDDDGFIALVNNANYKGFVDDDWQFDQLMTHFVDQMNVGNIVVWQTSNNGGGNWLVSFQGQPSSIQAFRQFEQLINVTTGELFLTNYSDLTMAAQFSDASIPAAHNTALKIRLDNGWYKLTVRQLFDPDNNLQYFDIETDENISFEIIIAPSLEFVQQPVSDVYWHEL